LEADMTDPMPLIAPLFAPADRSERFAKAAASGADAIIIDLEDAVAPERKALGRASLKAARDLSARIFVRINAPNTPWHEDDVEALADLPFVGIVLPKAENPAEILAIERKLGSGRTFVALIESARGVVSALQIAETPCVRQLAFGPVDYSLDLFISPNPEASAHALSMLAIASRAAGLPGPLDGPCLDLNGDEAIHLELARARDLGAGGKLCVHPSQVAKVIAGFAPTTSDLSRARQILSSGDELGARAIDGGLVDRPIVEWAQRIITRADRDMSDRS
jgi:citrate lyase subunit beta / citryl-CoA lyase